MVLLVATRELRYAAKQYELGDTFEASDKDARILQAIKKAKKAPAVKAMPVQRGVLPATTAATKAPTLPPDPPKEVTPTSAAKEVPSPAPEPPASASAPESTAAAQVAPVTPPVTPGPTSTASRYRRRDLQSQE